MSVKIHPTAIVAETVCLDNDVEIAPYAVIGEEVKIGSNTFIGPHSVIEFAEIGKGNLFTASAFIGTPPQDFSYHGEKTKIIIGDNNIIREGVSLHRGTIASNVTIIGSNCMIMAMSHAGHDCHIGSNVIITNYTGLSGHVEVGNNTVISGFCGVHQFVRIGVMTMIGAGSMVSLDVPPYCKVHGDRAKLVGLNLIGMRRNGINRESIRSVKETYKMLFLSGLTLNNAICKLKSMNISFEAKNMVEFCENSKRGIMRPRMLKGVTAEIKDE